MSTNKTLSNGTLSLRFMQRAKENKGVVQLDKAEVKDDGEWEVSREIKEAWGLVGNADDNGTGDGLDKVHEASYLPFLFGKDQDDGEGRGIKTKGRRVFNNKGEDISFKTTVVQPVASTSNANITSLSNSAPLSSTPSGKPLKTYERPSSISSTAKTYGKQKQSARDTIFGNDDVGVDLRAQKRSGYDEAEDVTPVPTLPNGFMKPAGVDEPKKPSTADEDDMGSGIINGGRAFAKRRVEEDGDTEKKKRRKKKKSAGVDVES